MNRIVPLRIGSVWFLAILAYCLIVIGCGGGSGNSSSGGTTPPPPPPPPPKVLKITAVRPFKIMSGVKAFQYVYISGNFFDFTGDPVGLIDGVAVDSVIESGLLKANIGSSDPAVAGIHTVEVSIGSVKSNALTVEYYAAKEGPQPFDAVKSYYLEDDVSIDSVEVADVDGDSIGDVMVMGTYLNQWSKLYVFKGKTDGTLSLAQTKKINGAGFWRMTSGDVNGDGYVDLVLTNILSYETRILTNDGHGNFSQASQEIIQGIDERKILLEDMNGDGLLDLVTLPSHYYKICLTLNEGSQFGATTLLGTPSSSLPLESQSFSVADFNADNRKDIMYTSYNSNLSLNEIRFLLQQPDGTFEDVLPDLPGLPIFTEGITEKATVIDLDKNGLPDLLVQIKDSSASITLNTYKNLGSNSFALVSSSQIATTADAGLYQMVSGDFDNDGYQDLAGINGKTNVLYLWGTGEGFVPQSVIGPNSTIIEAGDINGDGIADVVIGSISTYFSVIYGGKRDIPQPIVLSPSISGYLSAADVNGDGFIDLMVSGYHNGVNGAIYLNDGKGNFTFAASVSKQGVAIVDLDRDGKAELIGSDGSNLLIWPGNGNPEFPATPVSIAFGLGSEKIQFNDLNLDGILDIVTAGSALYGRGNYSFDLAYSNGCTSPYVVADSNGDGFPDIVCIWRTLFGSSDGYSSVNGANGLGYFTYGLNMVAGDFNMDGIDDVVTDDLIAYGHTDGVYYVQTNVNGLQSYTYGAKAVADFNGDGFPDILMGSDTYFDTDHVMSVLFTNDQKGGFQRSFFSLGVKANQILCADFNNDSLPDIAVSSSDGTMVFLNRYHDTQQAKTYKAKVQRKYFQPNQFQNKLKRKPQGVAGPSRSQMKK